MSKSHRSHRYSLPLATSLFLLSAACVFTWHGRRKLRKYRQEIEKQTQLRQEERKGRISAEKKLRKSQQEEVGTEGYQCPPIAVIESPFPDRRATPRQPILAPAARAFIRFNKQSIQFQHYEELAQFSHIWVIFIFHENTNVKGKGLPAKIAPPRLGGSRVGCLSTRSPHRPNPIGLSVCEIVSVTENYIEIRGVDFVHGTPVLDIKPYIPYDIIPSTYSLPMVTTSTGSPLPIRPLTVPSWIVESDIPLLPLSFTSSAELSLQEIVQQKLLKFYPSYSEVVEFISQVLRQDIRGVHQGRGKASPPPLAITDQTDPERGETTVDGGEGSGGGYQCRLDNLEIRFRIQQSEGEEDSAPERVRGAVVIEEVKYHDPKTTTTTTVKEQSSKK